VGLVAMSSSTFSLQEMGLEVTPVDGRETVGLVAMSSINLLNCNMFIILYRIIL